MVVALWEEMFSEPLDGRSYLELYERYLVRWLAGMREGACVATPPDDDALGLAWETARFVTSNARAAFPAERRWRHWRAGAWSCTRPPGRPRGVGGLPNGCRCPGAFPAALRTDLVGELKWGRRRDTGPVPVSADVADRRGPGERMNFLKPGSLTSSTSDKKGWTGAIRTLAETLNVFAGCGLTVDYGEHLANLIRAPQVRLGLVTDVTVWS